MAPTNIWPEHLTLDRHARVADGDIDGAREFAASAIADDHDVVIQFDNRSHRIVVNVFQREGSRWDKVAPIFDEDRDFGSGHDSGDLGVLMLRDKLSVLVPLRLADGEKLTRDEFEVVPEGSVAFQRDLNGTDGWYTRVRDRWQDPDGDDLTTDELLVDPEPMTLVWRAPGEPRPIPIRTNYRVHDEALHGGRTVYIYAGGTEGQYKIRDQVIGAISTVHYSDLTYVSTPARPLARIEAELRFIDGADAVCERCGDHGAVPVSELDGTPYTLTACRPHTRNVVIELDRHHEAMQLLTIVKYEQSGERRDA